MAVKDVTGPGILKAIEECRALGEEKFLSKYAFGRLTKYFLVHEGTAYPSKAILGVGHGYSGDGPLPLKWNEFSGGSETLKQLLNCGFPDVSSARPSSLVPATSAETAEEDFDEGERQKKEREILSRNPMLVARAKEHYGYVCQACGFDFEQAYGSHGRHYIECHHLIPLWERDDVAPTKLEDVTVLCSNCHRMVHRQTPSLDISTLKSMIKEATLSRP